MRINRRCCGSEMFDRAATILERGVFSSMVASSLASTVKDSALDSLDGGEEAAGCESCARTRPRSSILTHARPYSRVTTVSLPDSPIANSRYNPAASILPYQGAVANVSSLPRTN
jgi:hypothetical protein